MIDPFKITNFNQTDEQLEEFLLFSIAVAGKNAKTTSKTLSRFMMLRDVDETPFQYVKRLAYSGNLQKVVRASGFGTWRRITMAFAAVACDGLDLRTCTVDDLEGIFGIGPKTARFFVLHSRPNQRHAVLDVHILRYLREIGYDVPASTPSGKRYKEIEQIILKLADDKGLTPAQLDLLIWTEAQERKKVG